MAIRSTACFRETILKCESAFNELLRAHRFARDAGVAPWQFAVELSELTSRGLSHSQLRQLIISGLLEHASETTDHSCETRTFELLKSLRLSGDACFILTPDGFRIVEQQCRNPPSESKPQPRWDADSRELTITTQLIKRYRCPAQNQETILSAFEEEGWPLRIDDPLPPVSQRDPKRRLHDAIKSLNRNQLLPALQFSGDGTGEGVIWGFTPDFSPSDSCLSD